MKHDKLFERTQHHQVRVNKKYAGCERVSVTFAIYSSSTYLNDISEQLGFSPTRTGKKGDLQTPKSTRFVNKMNYWLHTTENIVRSNDLRHHIEYVVRILTPNKKVLIQLQAKKDVKMTVSVDWWGTTGPTIWPQQMMGLALLNLELQLNVVDYSVDD